MTNEQLRALCLAATPGPWTPAGPSFGEKLPVYYNCVCVDGGTDNDEDICGDMEHADAEYIAAMDPTTTLALLDESERLRGLLQYALDALNLCQKYAGERNLTSLTKAAMAVIKIEQELSK